MHDPLTQAFRIGRWVTIWHCDPLNFRKDHIYRRDDDSCGWFQQPYSKNERKRIEKLAKEQYRQIFNKQVATKEEKSYAYICNDPDCHSAIYWSWRSIKHLYKPKSVWQWGCKLKARELETIISLATNPIGNLQFSFQQIKDEESFEEFFFHVFGVYLRQSRPWWKHPRWHFWHWKIQVHPIQQFKRWAFSRCGTCGKSFDWGYSPVTNSWDNDGPNWFRGERDVHHSNCLHQEVK